MARLIWRKVFGRIFILGGSRFGVVWSWWSSIFTKHPFFCSIPSPQPAATTFAFPSIWFLFYAGHFCFIIRFYICFLCHVIKFLCFKCCMLWWVYRAKNIQYILWELTAPSVVINWDASPRMLCRQLYRQTGSAVFSRQSKERRLNLRRRGVAVRSLVWRHSRLKRENWTSFAFV